MACRTYILGGDNLTERFGLAWLYQSDTNVELTGHLDMPSRIGKTFHSWSDENGVEPYVREDEIFFGGRDISILAYIESNGLKDMYSKVREMNLYMDSFDGVQLLETDFGSFDVTVKNVTIEMIDDSNGIISLNFRQDIVPFVGSFPSVKSGGYGIDGYSWDDLGLIPCRPDRAFDRADSKLHDVSVYGFERSRVKWHQMNVFDLNLMVRAGTYSELKERIERLAWMLSLAGKRMLRMRDGSLREVFSTDGFTVSGLRVDSNGATAYILLSLNEIRQLDNIDVFADNEGEVLGNKQGQRIAYTF